MVSNGYDMIKAWNLQCVDKDQRNNDNLDLLVLWNIGTLTLPVVKNTKHIYEIKSITTL